MARRSGSQGLSCLVQMVQDTVRISLGQTSGTSMPSLFLPNGSKPLARATPCPQRSQPWN